MCIQFLSFTHLIILDFIGDAKDGCSVVCGIFEFEGGMFTMGISKCTMLTVYMCLPIWVCLSVETTIKSSHRVESSWNRNCMLSNDR